MTNEIALWIENIIQSCTDDFHFEAVDRLITLYNERQKDEDSYNDLVSSRTKKWNDMHGIIAPNLNK